MTSVSGKVALITGGANGLGAGVARQLHAKGAKVVVSDVDEGKLKETAVELGDRGLAVAADVRDLAAMQAAVQQGIERFGGIDIVVANAAIGAFGSTLQVDPEAFRTVVDVNLLGVFHTVRATLPSIIERRGYILIVSSMSAYSADAGLASYAATKAGVEHFANCLRLEVAHHGVAVGSAHTGFLDTPMLREGTAEVSAFKAMCDAVPGPLGKALSVENAAARFVKGIEGRKRRVNCPRWVEVARWFKPLLSTPFGEAPMRKMVPPLLEQMDAEVATLGRSMTRRYQALQDR